MVEQQHVWGQYEAPECNLYAISFLSLDISHNCGLPSAVVPHITDAIQEWVMRQAKVSVDDDGVEPQVCVIEVWVMYVS